MLTHPQCNNKKKTSRKNRGKKVLKYVSNTKKWYYSIIKYNIIKILNKKKKKMFQKYILKYKKTLLYWIKNSEFDYYYYYDDY